MAKKRMLRCVIKSNGYSTHFRKYRFDSNGREVIMDPSAKADEDVEGEPLVITQETYDYLREESGRALKFEPVGASDIEHEAAEMIERIAELEGECKELFNRIIELETQLEKSKAETIMVRAELNTAGLRIAELEGQPPKDPPVEAKPAASEKPSKPAKDK